MTSCQDHPRYSWIFIEAVKDVRSDRQSNPSFEMSIVVFATGPLKYPDSGYFLKQQQKVTWGKKVHANFLVKVKMYLQSTGHKALSRNKTLVSCTT